jgi:hypothetical protein
MFAFFDETNSESPGSSCSGAKDHFAPDFHRDLEDFDISDILFAKEHP